MLRPVIYRKMGWELTTPQPTETDTSPFDDADIDYQEQPPQAPKQEMFRQRLTPEEIEKAERELLNAKGVNTDENQEYVY